MEKINEKDESKIAGGAIINGEQKTMIESSETKLYEYKCDWCGKISYNSDPKSRSCPYCDSSYRYWETGNIFFDYEYVSDANNRSYWSKDT